MRRFIFWNMQGLSFETVSERLAWLHQLMAETDISVALLCEVMKSAQRLKLAKVLDKGRISTRPTAQEKDGRSLGMALAHNMALSELQLRYYRSYREERYGEKHPEENQKGYGVLARNELSLALETGFFSAESTRAPLHWVAPDGMHVYVLHAISKHGAARHQLATLIPLLKSKHASEPWMIVGDMNCPPNLLLKKSLEYNTSQIISYESVYVCLPEGATRWASGNLLDYVISNVPCRVVRLPETVSVTRPNNSAIESLLGESDFDHRPLQVEYHIDPRLAPSSGLGSGLRLHASVSSMPHKPPRSAQGLKKPLSLRDRMKKKLSQPHRPLPGLRRIRVSGDGNCMFRAVGVLVGMDHQTLRAEAVNYMLQHWNELRGFVEGEEYLADMAGNGVWGGHVELRVLSSILDRRIVVHRADGQRTRIGQGTRPAINLFYTGDHYDALRIYSFTQWVTDTIRSYVDRETRRFALTPLERDEVIQAALQIVRRAGRRLSDNGDYALLDRYIRLITIRRARRFRQPPKH